MELSASEVAAVLKSKGIKTLHHANSVITVCQFLRHGTLMSRGTIERRQLLQTAQSSDDDDRRYGLWFDVFTDSVDIHARAKRANVYGPVLLKISLDLIEKAYTGKIWVTKLNPTKWEGTKHEDRWFTSITDLEANFAKGCFDQMIVFRHSGGELPLNGYLEGIILDDPEIAGGTHKIDFFSMAFGALRLAMTEGGIKVPFHKRQCEESCKCKAQYQSDDKGVRTMYAPRVE